MQLAQLKATIKGLFLAFGVAGLASCGSGDEAGGGGSCGGVDESGICLQASLIDPFHLDGEFIKNVDVNFIADCDGDVATFDPEPSSEHFAEVTFSASLVSGTPVAASLVQVTSMTVTFTQNTTDPAVTCTAGAFAPNCNAVVGAGPAISQLTTPIDVTIPVGTSVTQTVILIDLDRKNLYTPAAGFDICTNVPYAPTGVPFCAAAGLAPAYLSYNVRYFFSGKDEFGNSVDATGATQITIGAYGVC